MKQVRSSGGLSELSPSRRSVVASRLTLVCIIVLISVFVFVTAIRAVAKGAGVGQDEESDDDEWLLARLPSWVAEVMSSRREHSFTSRSSSMSDNISGFSSSPYELSVKQSIEELGEENAVGYVVKATPEEVLGWYCHKRIPNEDLLIHITVHNNNGHHGDSAVPEKSPTENRKTGGRSGRKSPAALHFVTPIDDTAEQSLEVEKTGFKVVYAEWCGWQRATVFRHRFSPSSDAMGLVRNGSKFDLGVSKRKQTQKQPTLSAKDSKEAKKNPAAEIKGAPKTTVVTFPDIQRGGGSSYERLLISSGDVTHSVTRMKEFNDRAQKEAQIKWAEDRSLQAHLDPQRHHAIGDGERIFDSRADALAAARDETEVPKCRLTYLDESSEEKLTATEANMKLERIVTEEKEKKSQSSFSWPWTRRVECDSSISEQTTAVEGDKKGKKGKALILYMLSGKWNRMKPMATVSGTRPQEMSSAEDRNEDLEAGNFDFFLQFGYIGPNTTTQLFDGIDYVFFRKSSHVKVVTLGVEIDNVKILFVPENSRCDLCAQGRVLSYLRYQQRAKDFSWPYRSVIFTNSESRGPFLSSSEIRAMEKETSVSAPTTWVDILSIGDASRSKSFADEISNAAKIFSTVTGVGFDDTKGSATSLHLQAHPFIVVPYAVLPSFYEVYNAGGCWEKTMFDPVTPVVPAVPNGRWHCHWSAEVRLYDEIRRGLGTNHSVHLQDMLSGSTYSVTRRGEDDAAFMSQYRNHPLVLEDDQQQGLQNTNPSRKNRHQRSFSKSGLILHKKLFHYFGEGGGREWKHGTGSRSRVSRKEKNWIAHVTRYKRMIHSASANTAGQRKRKHQIGDMSLELIDALFSIKESYKDELSVKNRRFYLWKPKDQ